MNNPQHNPMRKRFASATVILFVVAIIIVTGTFNRVILTPTDVVAQTQRINSNTSSSQSANFSSNPLPLKTIFKQVENSVVQITSKTPTPSNSSNQSSSNVATLGSGFVYDKHGHIVTNGHVVGNAQIVDVTFLNGNRYTARVIGNDIYSDIAVLQISQNASHLQRQLLSSLKPLALGNSTNLDVGDQVIAIGNPFGLSDTMTTGIVSGIGRSLPASVGGGFLIPNAIQIDAPINPGNSGGPLLDTQGKMIGMNTAILSGTNTFSGIGFAIPSNDITRIVPALIEKGYYPHPYLGLRDGTLTSDLADAGIPTDLKGAYVDSLTKNGPADKAGIHGSTRDQYSKKHLGDIIIAADGHNITTSDDLVNYIGQHKSVGDNITLAVYRNGHTIDLKTTLAARPSPLPFLTILLAPPSSPSIPHSPTPPPIIP